MSTRFKEKKGERLKKGKVNVEPTTEGIHKPGITAADETRKLKTIFLGKEVNVEPTTEGIHKPGITAADETRKYKAVFFGKEFKARDLHHLNELLRKEIESMDLTHLVELLKGHGHQVRNMASNAILKRGIDDDTFDALVSLLEDDNSNVSWICFYMLGCKGGLKALAPMVDAIENRLASGDPKTIWVRTLGELGEGARGTLVEYTKHERGDVRAEAFKGLFYSFGPEEPVSRDFVPIFIDALLDKDPDVVYAAKNGLIKPSDTLREKDLSKLVEMYVLAEETHCIMAIGDLLCRMDDPSLYKLVSYDILDMHGDDDEVQKAAIHVMDMAISKKGAQKMVAEVLKELASQLASEDLAVVRRAVKGLGAWLAEWTPTPSYNGKVGQWLTDLQESMLKNPSKAEREVLAESFQALMDGRDESLYDYGRAWRR